MNCPQCNNGLQEKQLDGITVAVCEHCSGVWIGYSQFFQLEDESWDDDDKGELEFNPAHSELNCPVCRDQMIRFNYRYSELQLDSCPQGHGFWLDKGEEKMIKEIMTEDKKNYERKIKAECEWNSRLNNLLISPGFKEKIEKLWKNL